MTRRLGASALALALASTLPGCADTSSGEAARGRRVYLAQCVQCHAPDPTQAGALGPPLKGSSRELLEAKLLHGTYPPGYRPKRPTAVMPLQPQMASETGALAAFLK